VPIGKQPIGFGWEARRDEPGRDGTLQHAETNRIGQGDCNFRVRARFFATIVSAMTRPANCVMASPDRRFESPAVGALQSPIVPRAQAGPLRPRPLSGGGSCANRIGTDKTVFVLISIGGATNSPQHSFSGVGYLVQHVLHARRLR
jgi:hypothetical protein